jgi:hypothetical protein
LAFSTVNLRRLGCPFTSKTRGVVAKTEAPVEERGGSHLAHRDWGRFRDKLTPTGSFDIRREPDNAKGTVTGSVSTDEVEGHFLGHDWRRPEAAAQLLSEPPSP